jgi:uncharacterized protein YqgC (DUF456 family)
MELPIWLQNSLQVLTQILVLTFMIFGLLIIPIFPGLVIIWLAALVYGIIAGFGTLGWVMFAIITVLMLAGSFIDNLLMGTQAHKNGASWVSVVFALIFLLLGNFIIPIPVLGGLIAAFLTLFIAEWIRRKNHKEAWKAALGLATGFQPGSPHSVYNGLNDDRPVDDLGLDITVFHFGKEKTCPILCTRSLT